jgi:hypothetical protein
MHQAFSPDIRGDTAALGRVTGPWFDAGVPLFVNSCNIFLLVVNAASVSLFAQRVIVLIHLFLFPNAIAYFFFHSSSPLHAFVCSLPIPSLLLVFLLYAKAE